MKQVETNTYNVHRLLHVKGKKNVVAGEVRKVQHFLAQEVKSSHIIRAASCIYRHFLVSKNAKAMTT